MQGKLDEDLDDVVVEQQDFMFSLRNLTPSLSSEEIARYAMLRDKYERS